MAVDNRASPREPTISPPAMPTRVPHLRLPPGSCDSHAHVFGDQGSYPYMKDAAYIAGHLPLEDYVRMLTAIGCSRAVLVQPSVYGTDNSCMLDAMASSCFDLRGVAVVEPDVSGAELRALHEAGVRGIRINAASGTPGLRMEHASELAERIAPFGWHLQLFLDIGRTPGAVEAIARLPVPCVIDHFGHVRAEDGIEGRAFQALLGLARLDHVWFKLSGGYRVSRLKPPYEDVGPLAQALTAVAADRCIFGTDWPHPNVRRMDNDGDIVDALALWIPNAGTRTKVLVNNPARLYGFDNFPTALHGTA